MTTRQTITIGRQRFRVGPWHADPLTAQVAVAPHGPRPTEQSIGALLGRVRTDGYRSVVTSAVDNREIQPWESSGFSEFDRLHVLRHDLSDTSPSGSVAAHPPPDGLRLRRGRRGDRPTALRIDAAAFTAPWRLDEDGLDEAEGATPSSRFRVALLDGTPVGYAVTGRGAHQGFLQRLATDPAHQGRGVGTALVMDCLDWCRRRHCRAVFVNTQTSNSAALSLYRHLGFTDTGNDLVVLYRVLD